MRQHDGTSDFSNLIVTKDTFPLEKKQTNKKPCTYAMSLRTQGESLRLLHTILELHTYPRALTSKQSI